MKPFLTFIIILLVFPLHSQQFEWIDNFEGPSYGYALASDSSGNIVVAGYFHRSIDMDPGPDTFMLNGVINEMSSFIAKYDSEGSLIWARSLTGFGTIYIRDIELDQYDNILATGYFYNTIDFDPGPLEHSLKIDSTFTFQDSLQYFYGSDIFLLKLDSDGNFAWVKQLGGKLNDLARAISIDPWDNIYLTCEVQYLNSSGSDSIDLDPGPATHYFFNDGEFILKLNREGNFIWAKQLGTLSGISDCPWCNEHFTVSIEAAKADREGNIYFTGNFYQGISPEDFDPGPSDHFLLPVGYQDAFIEKLDSNGNFSWVIRMGGIYATCRSVDIDVDIHGNSFVTGTFFKTVGFDPGHQDLTSSSQSDDIFVIKINPEGSPLWTKRLGGPYNGESPWRIRTDYIGNVYTVGDYRGSGDYDPGSGTFNLPASDFKNNSYGYMSKLSSDGNFIWALSIKGADPIPFDVLVNNKEDVFCTGKFVDAVDFDFGPGQYYVHSTGIGVSAYLHKMSQSVSSAIHDIHLSDTISIDVIPNLSEGIFNIHIPDYFAGVCDIIVSDMMGHVIEDLIVHPAMTNTYVELNLTEYPPGMYQLLFLYKGKSVAKRVLRL